MPDHGKIRDQQVSYLASFTQWVRLKKYQYEVTFPLYMLTPAEKFVFNFTLFVLVFMLAGAAIFYLPNHLALVSNRLWYYVHGEFACITRNGYCVDTVNSLKATSALIVSPTSALTVAEETAETITGRLREL